MKVIETKTLPDGRVVKVLEPGFADGAEPGQFNQGRRKRPSGYHALHGSPPSAGSGLRGDTFHRGRDWPRMSEKRTKGGG